MKFPRRMICMLDSYPWPKDEWVTILGELDNMPGHCVVVYKHKVYSGYHLDSFREPTEEDEL